MSSPSLVYEICGNCQIVVVAKSFRPFLFKIETVVLLAMIFLLVNFRQIFSWKRYNFNLDKGFFMAKIAQILTNFASGV
jgi:hypothetical protein